MLNKEQKMKLLSSKPSFKVIKANITCHKKGLRGEEVCSFGLGKGQKEFLLESALGHPTNNLSHLALPDIRWA